MRSANVSTQLRQMAQISLQRSRVVARVSQRAAAGVPEHMRVWLEGATTDCRATPPRSSTREAVGFLFHRVCSPANAGSAESPAAGTLQVTARNAGLAHRYHQQH